MWKLNDINWIEVVGIETAKGRGPVEMATVNLKSCSHTFYCEH